MIKRWLLNWGGVTRCEGDKAWRVQPLDQWVKHEKHGKFQYFFLVLVILQLVYVF